MLYEKGVKYLTLSWAKRPIDETFTLQMNDESNYFRNKYTGSLCTYAVPDLYRNTEYKFRVSSMVFGERERRIITKNWLFLVSST
jgi:hypothetical protein